MPPVSEYLPYRGQSCIFACHIESVSAKHGVETRFDVVKQSLSRIITDIRDDYNMRNQARVAIYRFNSALKRMYPAQASSSHVGKDHEDALSAIANLRIDGYITDEYSRSEAVWDPCDKQYVVGYSFLERTLQDMRRNLRRLKRQDSHIPTTLVLVSDGTNETHFTQRGDEASTRNCRRIRRLGIDIYTIYLTSTHATAETFMRDCATPGGYMYTAEDGEDIKNAFEALSSRLRTLQLTH